MRKALNERQRAALEWVSHGCLGAESSSAHKTSCQPLQNRGLIRISRRGGQWGAVLTDAGSHYLAHGSYPSAAAPAKRLAVPRLPPVTETADGGVTDRPSPAPRQPRKSFTEQLLEELEASGGRIVKPLRDAGSWPSRLAAARRSGRIPRTKELHGGWCREGYEIKLVDTPAWRLAVLEPVAVPSRLTRPHKVVQAMHKTSRPLGLTKAVQVRGLRLVNALLIAAEHDGHTCAAGVVDAAPPAHRRHSRRPHFTITAQGQTIEFFVVQDQDRTRHIPTEKELAEAKKHSWIRIPQFDYAPSDRLRLALSGGSPHRASEWADRTDRLLEDQLPEIVQEITLRGEAAERKRLAELEAARQKRLRWEAAMTQAREDFAESYRVKQLQAQESAWRRATRLSEYLLAAREQVATLSPGADRTQAEQWIEWATGHVAGLQATAERFRLPDIPETRADDLEPFLHGWSPYGPY